MDKFHFVESTLAERRTLQVQQKSFRALLSPSAHQEIKQFVSGGGQQVLFIRLGHAEPGATLQSNCGQHSYCVDWEQLQDCESRAKQALSAVTKTWWEVDHWCYVAPCDHTQAVAELLTCCVQQIQQELMHYQQPLALTFQSAVLDISSANPLALKSRIVSACQSTQIQSLAGQSNVENSPTGSVTTVTA